MGYAFIFPGQGSQYVEMGREMAAIYPEAAAVFERANQALGRDLVKLINEGPAQELTLTWNAQPAILTVSVACLEALKARVELTPLAVAGHSLGEYSALVAAGALSFEDAVRTVEKRGRYMQDAVPVGLGKMCAVLGLGTDELERLCEEVSTEGDIVGVANDNCPGQVVVSGHAGAVGRLAQIAKANGAKRTVELNVSAPFHSALMEPAALMLSGDLAALGFKSPSVPVVANVDGKANTDVARIPALLKSQVNGAVLWQDCIRALAALGADKLVEIGPGKVLTGMTRRIDRGIESFNIENPASLDSFVGGL